MLKITNELKELGNRIIENKMRFEEINGEMVNVDERELTEICNRTFGNGTPTTENLELFNAFLVTTAEKIAEPSVKQILGLLADIKKVPAGTVRVLELPKTVKPKFLVGAKGTGADLVRISGDVTKQIATPEPMTYGAYYEMTTFMADPKKAFQDAVANLANAKLEFYFEKVFEVMKTAISSSKIPVNNVKEGANLSIPDFQKVENTMIRLGGGRPTMVADISLINHFANQIPIAQAPLMTDSVKDMLRDELVPSRISKTIAINFPNNWIDENNSKVKFDVTQGFIFPSGKNGKAFAITEFGGQRTYTDIDTQTEQVKLTIHFDCNITLLNGRYIGSITDSSVTV